MELKLTLDMKTIKNKFFCPMKRKFESNKTNDKKLKRNEYLEKIPNFEALSVKFPEFKK
jgi:hypothetical protein